MQDSKKSKPRMKHREGDESKRVSISWKEGKVHKDKPVKLVTEGPNYNQNNQ